jgi:hypothetical protein
MILSYSYLRLNTVASIEAFFLLLGQSDCLLTLHNVRK